MSVLFDSRSKCARLIVVVGLLALPTVSAGQVFPPNGVLYFRGKCDAATAIPPFLCPPAAVPVPDTNGPAGAPDGAITGLDVPCNTSLDCGGLTCYTGACTAPAAVIGASCNVPGDCGIGGACSNPDVSNDTTLLCWTGVPPPMPGPAFCADLYHGANGPGITKGQESDGVCVAGGIPAPAAAIAPALWMLDNNGAGSSNPPWMTCFDPNPAPGPAVSPIVAPSPPLFFFYPPTYDIMGIGVIGQGGVLFSSFEDPDNPIGFSTTYVVGMHDCTVVAFNNIGDALPYRCSTPGPNPGPACGPNVGCLAPSVCLGLGGPIVQQVADYDGICGQAPGPPPAENLCP